MNIAVCVVCYNNEEEVIEFAKMLEKQTIRDSLYLYVTCNAIKDIALFESEIQTIGIKSKIMIPDGNLGYLHGCLYGIGERILPVAFDWVIITNTDVTFESDDFLELLFCNPKITDETWGLAPDIVRKSNGNKQNPFLLTRISPQKVWLWKTAYGRKATFVMYFILAAIKRKLRGKEIEDTEVEQIYAQDGSFFALRYQCVDSIIMNQDPIFMYGEELLVAEIIRENGKSILFNANVHMTHNENSVTSAIQMAKKQKWFKDSFRYLYERFFKE